MRVRQVLWKKIEEMKKSYSFNQDATCLPVSNLKTASYLLLLQNSGFSLYGIVTDKKELTVNYTRTSTFSLHFMIDLTN
jgi:hypothetical protein